MAAVDWQRTGNNSSLPVRLIERGVLIREVRESVRCGGGWASSWLFLSLGLGFAGCGGRDVTGPVPTAKLSTDKVSYDRKPGPGLQRFDFGELVVTDKLESAVLPIPSTLEQNTEIIVKGTLRWPKQAGKITIMELEFYDRRNGVDVGLAGALTLVNEKEGLYHSESELSKTPIEFVGKCKLRLVAFTIPIDFDPSLGVLPKETSVVVGLAEVEMR